MMEDILEVIKTLTQPELQKVMEAIEARYNVLYPQWDVLYIALHKDPELRKQELAALQRFLSRG